MTPMTDDEERVAREIRDVFDRYEAALMANDVETLIAFFWRDPRAVRLSPGGGLYGFDEIVGFRQTRDASDIARDLGRVEILVLGLKMWGGESFDPSSISWPQPLPYTTDYDKAKDLLAQTEYKDGFEVPLSFDLGAGAWAEPAALLIQEGLAKIGINATIDKIPGANWRTVTLVEKKLPLLLENFGG